MSRLLICAAVRVQGEFTSSRWYAWCASLLSVLLCRCENRVHVQPVVRMVPLLSVVVIYKPHAGRAYDGKYASDYILPENMPRAQMAHIVFMLPESCLKCCNLRRPVERFDANE